MATISIEVRDNDLWTEVFGASVESMGWWLVKFGENTGWDRAGIVSVTLTDPDTGLVEGQKLLTVDHIAEAVSKAHAQGYNIDWSGMDAYDADTVLQIALLGKVVFG